MKNILKLALVGAIALGLGTTVASADAIKGQKLYVKKLKSACGGLEGSKMANKHTQSEWKAVYDSGKLADKIKEYCPGATDKNLKDNWITDYYDFFYKFASDSGNVPSC